MQGKKKIEMKKMRLSKDIIDFSRVFERNGYRCYLVGGAVRNMVLGQKPIDYDFATDATPPAVRKLFKSVIPTGIKHGTVTVLWRGHKLEVTTFRLEGNYSNARHPDEVNFTPSLLEDLKRRDFTINSMAINPQTGELIDPHGGRSDLKDRLIRAIGLPEERFREDGLRLMRACRFAAQLDFRIEEETLRAMSSTVDTIDRVSAERIRDELMKTLTAARPSVGLLVMSETGLLDRILPELAKCRGIYQGGLHDFDVFRHSLLACDGAPADRPMIRLAALLHDLGKAVTVSKNEVGDTTFYRHEAVGEELCRKIMRRLRFSHEEEKKVCLLVGQHMFHYQDEWTDGAVRRFIARVGLENLEDLFELRRADQYGMKGIPVTHDSLAPLRKRIDTVMRQKDALTLRDLAVDGTILSTEAGIPRGPDMGKVLNYLMEAVLDDSGLNEKDRLVPIAEKFYREYLGGKQDKTENRIRRKNRKGDR